MLRIADQWYGSDLGLQRQGNEDNYFVRSPLFAVRPSAGNHSPGGKPVDRSSMIQTGRRSSMSRATRCRVCK